MRDASTQGMSLWVAPLILHTVIAVTIADRTETSFWLVLLAMIAARAYFGGVRLLGRTIAWYAYEKEQLIRDRVESFALADFPAPRHAEFYTSYFNRIADSTDMPKQVQRNAISTLDYIALLDKISLIDRRREEAVLIAAMSRYAAQRGQGGRG